MPNNNDGLKNDLLDLIETTIDKKLKNKELNGQKISDYSCGCKQGYPGKFKRLKEIKNLNKIN